VKKVFITASALFALAVVVVALAQGPPSLPSGHIPVASSEDAATCYQCHESPGPLSPDVSSFCTYCHDFTFSHRTAPPPAHPINLDWPSKDCGTCHRLHAGPNPTHQVSAQMPNSSFCVACHLPPGEYSGDDPVKDFCAKCHNLGIPEEHPSGDGKTADFCYSCHQVGE
jgi:predicted CXXCH cytochrome family protein